MNNLRGVDIVHSYVTQLVGLSVDCKCDHMKSSAVSKYLFTVCLHGVDFNSCFIYFIYYFLSFHNPVVSTKYDLIFCPAEIPRIFSQPLN